MKRLILLLVFCLSGQFIFAQLLDNLRIGLESNSAWYNDDKKTGSFYDTENQDGDKHIRSNNYLKLDYSFLKNFQASVQIESYEPLALINYSPNLEGTNIGTYSLNYKSSKLDVTAGHYYAQFGSGLILRNWEDRQLGLNNALFGGKVEYTPMESIHLTGLYGKQRVGFDTSDGEVFGANVEIDLSSIIDFESTSLSLGLSYVGRKEATEIVDPNFDELTNAFSGRLDFYEGSFYSSLEYVSKSEDAIVQVGQIMNNFVKPGNAILFNAGFSQKGFGLDATFRRLENMSFYSERQKSGNLFIENIVNYTPGLTKQHDYLLTNIFVYQAQPQVSFLDPGLLKAGEIGGQIDLFYQIKKDTPLGGKYGTKIAFNMSYWAGLKGDFDYNNLDYSTDLFGFGNKYFSDINFEIRKKWNSKWNSIFYYVNQYYSKKQIEGNFGAEPIKSNIVVAEATRKLNGGKSFRIEAQKLWSDSDGHDWVGGTFEFNLSSKYSVYINDIYNSGNDSDTAETHYFNIGGSYTKGSTRLGLNYGRQRAGLICVGGVCRYAAEATGVSANLTMSF
ncbi:hypothetical protein DFQ11_10197 [Winogradskyella epiphytica]|uniref:Uncharacterized protein n=1 Tax=Winogradskyella epiphytica TaxID=262005 RepID=A0A2V4WYE6_9FLAO|nr:DUF6029 family protein [Winogradskyella epiphytica]PYE82672.1 hypothetical protein DFQ11_10197 [Winogradskyella epiphytica]GGW72592.1 hypothetical protein GCM10008085_26150 [Winogradskyella epiphytica]